jgi:dihydroorotate dehydrogenase
MDTLYRRIIKPILFKIHPDTTHELFAWGGELIGSFAILRWLFGLFYNYRGRDISKVVDGIKYRTPILLSAGFDPDGRQTRTMSSFAFGGEEIGSITANKCAGNPRPHYERLTRDRSFIVHKGLKNNGVDALIARLKNTKRLHDFVLGISIGRTNEPSASGDVETGINDYLESFKKLNVANLGDYYTINISCPNAFGGETFTDPALLAQLLPRLKKIKCAKPIYLKMPINLPWEQFVALADIADQNKINGLVIGNLNKNYDDLKYREEAPKEYSGGLSGSPCFALSNELIRKTREKYDKRFTIIGVGGIMSPEDAMEKFAAGADLVELITGMIYEGPGLIKKICKRYAEEKLN